MAGQLSVLVAEDYAEFRAGIIAMLEPLGLSCIPVANGRDAISVLAETTQDVHLLVTDMDMPVHTGWEVIDAARRSHGSALPIIMQTGEAHYRYVIEKAQALGVVLLGKRDVPELLIPAVKKALRL
jgi:CheY-like chemotaxis protein